MTSLKPESLSLLTASLSFVGGALSFVAAKRVRQSRMVRRVQLWRLDHQRAVASRCGDRARVAELDFLLPIWKLCAADEKNQLLGIMHLCALKDERSFGMLAARLGTEFPPLHPSAKALLLSALKELARSNANET